MVDFIEDPDPDAPEVDQVIEGPEPQAPIARPIPKLQDVPDPDQETFDPQNVSDNILGPMDGWLGVVGFVYDAGTNTQSSYRQEIFVTRVGVHYQTNNDPQGYDIAPVFSQKTATGVSALPFPVRHDQNQSLVAVGDIVFVMAGKDGRAYYMVDDLPFLAQVRSDGGSVKEDNAGGAGLTTLTVIRKVLAGTPTSTVLTDFADLQDKDSADVELTDVIPVGPVNSSHGYRCGDLIWVQKRGVYLFTWANPKTFVGIIQAAGPEAEGDFATNHYWIREADPTIAYSNNAWTVTWAVKTQTDPTSSGGRFGRWIDAVNLAEGAAKHGLATGELVTVTEVCDPASREIGYVMERAPIPTTGLTTTGIWYWDGSSMVTTDAPSEGDVTVFNDVNKKWESKSISEAIETALGFVVHKRYNVTGDGTVTVDAGDWQFRMIWYSVATIVAETGAADQAEAQWDDDDFGGGGHVAPRIDSYFVADGLTPGDRDLVTVTESSGGGTARVYIDDDGGSGALKIEFASYAVDYQFVLTAKGGPQLTQTEAITV